ncbi:histidine triad nucleotide-binding protein [Meiothermus granaticius]|uniref:Purine nucleoside phosphoramidase n=1 Tax=Meiothermus granaticius NBRC 107808 TaxID=1227551 RepID=A0A399FC38_9DEIN|nr:histidine triad nucleotide-binding protein [Meiothermus granaticius]MCL6526766.1 histidine triad nucleotide-binding protein [Thermaceae bacterium]RIH92532.1 Purine nucleoside phosphoramidase [Meiothermus granaticius NBRC 107808]GEM87020.1 histidine triad nucleotide-binding protein [Meiothermus granaticius NBRC 107808]
MLAEDCVFCRIVRGELPARRVYEDEGFLAFHDIRPKMPVHLLVIPKEHIPRFSDYPDTEEGERKLGALYRTTNRIARQLGLEGYRMYAHVGEKGGQEVFHVHVHLLSEG